jgi:uncharacterized membrane protein YtjA (UPF0391 family)
MGVEFEEKKIDNSYNYHPGGMSITNLIIKLGLAKNESGAKKVMFIIMIVCFVLSFYFFSKI